MNATSPPNSTPPPDHAGLQAEMTGSEPVGYQPIPIIHVRMESGVPGSVPPVATPLPITEYDHASLAAENERLHAELLEMRARLHERIRPDSGVAAAPPVVPPPAALSPLAARLAEEDAYDDAREAAEARGIGAGNLAAILHHRAKVAAGLTLQPLTLAAWVLLDAIANPVFRGRADMAKPLDLLHLALCMTRPEIAEEVVEFAADGVVTVKMIDLNKAAMAIGRTLTDRDLKQVMAHVASQMNAVPEGAAPLAEAGTAGGAPVPPPVG